MLDKKGVFDDKIEIKRSLSEVDKIEPETIEAELVGYLIGSRVCQSPCTITPIGAEPRRL